MRAGLVGGEPGRDRRAPRSASLSLPSASARQAASSAARSIAGSAQAARANLLGRGAGRQVEASGRALRSAAGRSASPSQRAERSRCSRSSASPSASVLSPSSTASVASVRLDRRLPARQHLLLRLAHQVGGGARLDHVEMRHGTPASSGKRRSSDWQKPWMVMIGRPGRQVEHARQAGCAHVAKLAAPSAGRPGAAARSSPQRRIRQDRETAEIVLDPRHHLGGRRLGEGEAEDLLRLGAGQQQAQHPIGEHAGLAGAGRGGDPDRACRVGRAALLGRRAGCGRCRRGPSVRGHVSSTIRRAATGDRSRAAGATRGLGRGG